MFARRLSQSSAHRLRRPPGQLQRPAISTITCSRNRVTVKRIATYWELSDETVGFRFCRRRPSAKQAAASLRGRQVDRRYLSARAATRKWNARGAARPARPLGANPFTQESQTLISTTSEANLKKRLKSTSGSQFSGTFPPLTYPCVKNAYSHKLLSPGLSCRFR